VQLRYVSLFIAASFAMTACSSGGSSGTSPTTVKGATRTAACVVSIVHNTCVDPSPPPTAAWPGAIADGNFSNAAANFWDVASGSGFAGPDAPNFWYSCAEDEATHLSVSVPLSQSTTTQPPGGPAVGPGPMTVINFSDFPAASGLNPWSAQIGSSTGEAPTINGGHQILYGICYDFTAPVTGNLSFWAKEITNETLQLAGPGVAFKGYQAAAILAGPAPVASGLPFPAVRQWLYQKKANADWANYSFSLANVGGENVTLFFGVESPGSGTSLEQRIAGVSTPLAPNPNPHVVAEFPTSGKPFWITSGPDGNMWLTEQTPSFIGRLTLTGSLTEFATPTANSEPSGIVAGVDGNLWFGESAGGVLSAGKIARMSPDGKTVTEFAGAGPAAPILLIDRGDGFIWYTESTSVGNISFLIKASGLTGSLGGGSFPFSYGIAAGPDGNLYITNSDDGKIERQAGIGGMYQWLQLSPMAEPGQIIVGPDGNLWFTETVASKIGRLSPSSFTVTEFSTLTAFAQPTGITAGKDGNLWFTEATADASGAAHIGRITTSGVVTEYPVPYPGNSIATASDGSLWYIESYNAVAKFVP
jgi:streptogramin lyase